LAVVEARESHEALRLRQRVLAANRKCAHEDQAAQVLHYKHQVTEHHKRVNAVKESADALVQIRDETASSVAATAGMTITGAAGLQLVAASTGAPSTAGAGQISARTHNDDEPTVSARATLTNGGGREAAAGSGAPQPVTSVLVMSQDDFYPLAETNASGPPEQLDATAAPSRALPPRATGGQSATHPVAQSAVTPGIRADDENADDTHRGIIATHSARSTPSQQHLRPSSGTSQSRKRSLDVLVSRPMSAPGSRAAAPAATAAQVAADLVMPSPVPFYPERNLDLEMANQVTVAAALAAPPSPARSPAGRTPQLPGPLVVAAESPPATNDGEVVVKQNDAQQEQQDISAIVVPYDGGNAAAVIVAPMGSRLPVATAQFTPLTQPVIDPNLDHDDVTLLPSEVRSPPRGGARSVEEALAIGNTQAHLAILSSVAWPEGGSRPATAVSPNAAPGSALRVGSPIAGSPSRALLRSRLASSSAARADDAGALTVAASPNAKRSVVSLSMLDITTAPAGALGALTSGHLSVLTAAPVVDGRCRRCCLPIAGHPRCTATGEMHDRYVAAGVTGHPTMPTVTADDVLVHPSPTHAARALISG
jgi:hypothetical protein